MFPLPSAVKLPTLAETIPGLGLASAPLIENEYAPCRLALVKFPVAGGGGGVDDPLLPHETITMASAATAGKISGFIAHPVAQRICWPVAAGILAGSAARAPDRLSGSTAPG